MDEWVWAAQSRLAPLAMAAEEYTGFHRQIARCGAVSLDLPFIHDAVIVGKADAPPTR